MNNTKSLNKKFKTKQFKAVLRLVVLIFTIISLLIGAAWSWFADQKEATASGISMTMQTADFLAVSIDGGQNFYPSIDVLKDSMFADLNMKDITGNGITFYKPKFTNSIGNLILDAKSEWPAATPNIDYISLNLTFRSPFSADIYVANGTQVITKCETVKANGVIAPSTLLGSDTYNKSSYGDFSKDAIVGALRMSVLNSDNVREFLWIPRPDVLLTVSNDLQNYTLDVGNDATSIIDVENRLVTGTHYFYDSNRNPTFLDNSLTSSSIFTADVGIPGSEITKISTASTPTDDGYYIGSATVNIWIEGRDNEARRALSDGEFNILLNFVSVATDS